MNKIWGGRAWVAPAQRRKPLEFLRYEPPPRKAGRRKPEEGGKIRQVISPRLASWEKQEM